MMQTQARRSASRLPLSDFVRFPKTMTARLKRSMTQNSNALGLEDLGIRRSDVTILGANPEGTVVLIDTTPRRRELDPPQIRTTGLDLDEKDEKLFWSLLGGAVAGTG